EAPTAAPGGSIVLPADAQVVVLPDDTEEPVGGSSSYRLTGPAGVYRVIGARDTLVFAVNPPASESDLTRLDADEMRGWLAGADVETVDRIDGWAGAVYRHRLGAESWRPFALLALLVLLIEPLVAASGLGGRARRTSAARPPDLNRASPAAD